MANHVYTTINITGNKEVMEKLEEIKIKVEENNNDNYLALAKGFFDDVKNEYGWFGDNIGAKWCYHDEFFVDIDSEYAEIRTTSAWYPPLELVKHIFKICSEIDPDCEIDGDYENESPSYPVGGFAVTKNGFNEEENEEEIEYPDEDDYEIPEGEYYNEDFNNAMDEFYDKVANAKNEMRELARQNLQNSGEVETTEG